MKRMFVLVLAALATSFAPAQTGDYQVELTFVNHLQAGMHEQDVFIEREAGANEVYRATAADEDTSVPLYAATEAVAHNPSDMADIGPFAKGQPLDITLGEWLAGAGSATLSCEGGQGSLQASFEHLVPDATYTFWHFYTPAPATVPFQSIDLPLGARDGSQNVFTTDANGQASFSTTFDGCVSLSHESLTSALAVAYHSDGQTYGLSAGDFGANSHVQLFVPFPTAAVTGN